MGEHTPGEWAQLGVAIYSQRAAQVVCELSEPNPGRYIEHKCVELGSPAWDVAMANGARIVSCVNACAGLRTEALEQDVVKKLRIGLERVGELAEAHGCSHTDDDGPCFICDLLTVVDLALDKVKEVPK